MWCFIFRFTETIDCLQDFDLFWAKLYAYGYDYKSLKLILSFLSNKKCRTKIDSSFSEWEHLLSGLPQVSGLGPLLFNIYTFDAFLFMAESNVANYADDVTLYVCEKKLSDVERKLESESLILFELFRDTYLKANSGKSRFVLTTDKKLKINVKGSLVSNEEIVKLLGVAVNSKLSFEYYLSLLWKSVSQKLHVLAKVSQFF